MRPTDQRKNAEAAHPAQAQTLEEENCALVRRLWEVWNTGELDPIEELVDHNFASFGERVDGQDFMRGLVAGTRRAFPDGRFSIELEVASGEWVVHSIMRGGTFKESWQGLMDVDPTGKSFEVRHVHMFRVRDSRVVEHWAVRDDLGMLRQLGVLPETGNLARINLGRPPTGGGAARIAAEPLPL